MDKRRKERRQTTRQRAAAKREKQRAEDPPPWENFPFSPPEPLPQPEAAPEPEIKEVENPMSSVDDKYDKGVTDTLKILLVIAVLAGGGFYVGKWRGKVAMREEAVRHGYAFYTDIEEKFHWGIDSRQPSQATADLHRELRKEMETLVHAFTAAIQDANRKEVQEILVGASDAEPRSSR